MLYGVRITPPRLGREEVGRKQCGTERIEERALCQHETPPVRHRGNRRTEPLGSVEQRGRRIMSFRARLAGSLWSAGCEAGLRLHGFAIVFRDARNSFDLSLVKTPGTSPPSQTPSSYGTQPFVRSHGNFLAAMLRPARVGVVTQSAARSAEPRCWSSSTRAPHWPPACTYMKHTARGALPTDVARPCVRPFQA
jgi:hypothetical protein